MARWVDSKGEHARVMLREVGTWNYTWLDVDPRGPIPQQVAERLKVRPEEIVIPPHVKLDLAKLE